ncbi:hypothetical protein [Pseudomonas sp. PICF141]|uniref:hypothetical protein n=1 Tax=Pseudomonas sp. PICF141 TaxID=1949067 RepID=UPI000BABD55C|nr:hypothetical protein [Pseudomonas sp. PICF141]PAU63483.1 hypothetical protein BZL43_00335 [Pseudomonas sp. PICF141]
MHVFFVPVVTFASLLLTGCSFSPNTPTSTLQTDKSPEQYVDCVEPKLKDNKLNPTVSRNNRSYTIVMSSQVAVDNVLAVYKAENGTKVYLYERPLTASTFLVSSLERAALECL